MKRVYLDYASTTPIDKRVLNEFVSLSKDFFGNPSSIYAEGVIAKNKLHESRKIVADFLSCRSHEIFFTSGGTESNNLAIFGLVERLKSDGVVYKDMHIISSVIEHSSVLKCLDELKQKGVQVDYLPVNDLGHVNPKDLRKLLKKETVLVSVMFANNEIGTIQPIKEIAKEVRHFKKNSGSLHGNYPVFHTDASQGACYEELNVDNLGVDMLVLDGQKMYGPRGVGALYVKSGINLKPMILGGGQEDGVRSGTENLGLIGSFAKAVLICEEEREKERKRVVLLRDFLFDGIRKIFNDSVVNGGIDLRLVNNINISFPEVDTEMLALRLDSKGFSVSTKSACMAGEKGSYVVKSLGGPEFRHLNTVRVSVGRYTTKSECVRFLKTLLILKKKFF
jgi:cysteine desulfurase